MDVNATVLAAAAASPEGPIWSGWAGWSGRSSRPGRRACVGGDESTEEVGLPVTGTEAVRAAARCRPILSWPLPSIVSRCCSWRSTAPRWSRARGGQDPPRPAVPRAPRQAGPGVWWRSRWYAPEGVGPVVALVPSGRSEKSVLARSRCRQRTWSGGCETPFPVIGTTLARLGSVARGRETCANAARGSPQSLTQAPGTPSPHPIVDVDRGRRRLLPFCCDVGRGSGCGAPWCRRDPDGIGGAAACCRACPQLG